MIWILVIGVVLIAAGAGLFVYAWNLKEARHG